MNLFERVEGLIFDVGMKVTVPVLIWWVNKGLRREDLSEELHEFWREYKSE